MHTNMTREVRMRRYVIFIALLGALLPFAVSLAAAAESKTLFVGNSYSFANGDLVAQGYAELLSEATGKLPVVEMVAKGGYTFVGHLEDAGTEGEQLKDLLTAEGATWSTVVLQEQSVIPAYHIFIADGWYDSLKAAGGLDDLAEAAGADTVFLMTWGRREGLPQDLETLPDFLTMQGLLAGGYAKYADYTSTPDRPVKVAPVGLAWQAVWEDAVAKGEDPLAHDGLFWRLYTGDGSHPSVLGSYLAALVVFATISGHDPAKTSWKPDAVTEEEGATLRSVARRVVLGEPVEPPVEVVEPAAMDVAVESTDFEVLADIMELFDLLEVEALASETVDRGQAEATSETGDPATDTGTPSTGKGNGCSATWPAAGNNVVVFLLLVLMMGVGAVLLRRVRATATNS
jgi:hypothetical protein